MTKQKNTPQVTVLMSVYNDQEFLKKSIDSILEQSFKDFEFLIFDDCSNDNSPNILQEYVKKDSRIKLITNNTNRGLGYNLAKGVKIAKGKYIARMDSDDISLPNRLEKQLLFLKENPKYDLVGSSAIQIDQYGNEFGLKKVPYNDEDIKKYICLCPIIHPTVIFKKEKIIQVGNYNNLRRKQGFDLWLRCVDNNLKFKNLSTALLKYRYGGNYFIKYSLKNEFGFIKIGFPWCFKKKTNIKNYIRILSKLIKCVGPITFKRRYSNFYISIGQRYF